MSFSSFSDNWTLANSRRGTFVTLNSLPWHQIWDTGEPGWLLPCKAPTSAQNALLRKLKESGLSVLNHWPLRVSHSHSGCWIPLLGRDLLYGATNRWIYGQLETRMDNTAPSRDQPQQHLLSMASQCTWNLSPLDVFFSIQAKNFCSRPSVSGNKEQFKDWCKVQGQGNDFIWAMSLLIYSLCGWLTQVQIKRHLSGPKQVAAAGRGGGDEGGGGRGGRRRSLLMGRLSQIRHLHNFNLESWAEKLQDG